MLLCISCLKIYSVYEGEFQDNVCDCGGFLDLFEPDIELFEDEII